MTRIVPLHAVRTQKTARILPPPPAIDIAREHLNGVWQNRIYSGGKTLMLISGGFGMITCCLYFPHIATPGFSVCQFSSSRPQLSKNSKCCISFNINYINFIILVYISGSLWHQNQHLSQLLECFSKGVIKMTFLYASTPPISLLSYPALH